MNLIDLQNRALEIVKQYEELNKVQKRANWTITEYMQAFVGDVGDLGKLIMAKNNFRSIPNHEEKLQHELGDCLWALLIIAKELNIDPEKAFLGTMLDIEKKIKLQLSS